MLLCPQRLKIQRWPAPFVTERRVIKAHQQVLRFLKAAVKCRRERHKMTGGGKKSPKQQPELVVLIKHSIRQQLPWKLSVS